MIKSRYTAFALSFSLILGACGGGGDGGADEADVSPGDNANVDPGDGGGATAGAGSFSECFNPVLYQDGTFYTSVLDIGVGELTSTTSITTNIEWNGAPYTREVREDNFVSSFNGAISKSKMITYYSVDSENRIIARAGQILIGLDSETGEVTSTITEVLTPPPTTRFDLSPGETGARAYQIDRTTETEFGSTNEVVEEASTFRFVGIESITVPAGTVDACRLEIETVKEDVIESGTWWSHKGSGITVKVGVDGVVGMQLESAVLNGASVF